MPAGEAQAPALRTLRVLWTKMTGIYGGRWTSAYGDSPERFQGDSPTGELTAAGDVWSQGLTGLSRAELARGVSRALLSAEPWPPTLPEFRALALDIPTLAQVQLVLARRTEQGENVAAFCRLVWRFLDAYRFARSDMETSMRMVRDAYLLAREYRMALGELPAAPIAALSTPDRVKPTRASEETAETHMDAIAELLRMRRADDGSWQPGEEDVSDGNPQRRET